MGLMLAGPSSQANRIVTKTHPGTGMMSHARLAIGSRRDPFAAAGRCVAGPGHLPTERVPLWAAHWIAAGYDGQAIAELAGLHGDDPQAVRDLVGPALAECGVSMPDDQTAAERERAAAMVAFIEIARSQISGHASERWVVDKVVEIAEPFLFDWSSPACRWDSYGLSTTAGEPAGAAPTNSSGQSSGKPA